MGPIEHGGLALHSQGLAGVGKTWSHAAFDTIDDTNSVSATSAHHSEPHLGSRLSLGSRARRQDSEPSLSTPRQSQRQRRCNLFAPVDASQSVLWQDLPASVLIQVLDTDVKTSVLELVCKSWRSACVEFRRAAIAKEFTAVAMLKLDGRADLKPLPSWCKVLPRLNRVHLILQGPCPRPAPGVHSVRMPVSIIGPADIRELSQILRRLELDLLVGRTQDHETRYLDLTITAHGCDVQECHVKQALLVTPLLHQVLRTVCVTPATTMD